MKYLKFVKTVKCDKIKFLEGEIYPVTYEHKDCYILGTQYGIKCGIGKENENNIFIVIDKEGAR